MAAPPCSPFPALEGTAGTPGSSSTPAWSRAAQGWGQDHTASLASAPRPCSDSPTWDAAPPLTLKTPKIQSRARFSLSPPLPSSRCCFVLQQLLLLPCQLLLLLWINSVFYLFLCMSWERRLLNLPCRFVGLTGISTSSRQPPYLNPVLGCLQDEYLQKYPFLGRSGTGICPSKWPGWEWWGHAVPTACAGPSLMSRGWFLSNPG